MTGGGVDSHVRTTSSAPGWLGADLRHCSWSPPPLDEYLAAFDHAVRTLAEATGFAYELIASEQGDDPFGATVRVRRRT